MAPALGHAARFAVAQARRRLDAAEAAFAPLYG